MRRLVADWRQRGSGLLIIIAAIAVLVLFTGAIMSATVRTLQATTEGEKNDKARYAAYSGIQSALNKLNSGPGPTGAGWCNAISTAPPGPPASDADEDAILVSFTSDSAVNAIVTVYNNSPYADPAHASNTTPDGTAIPPGQIYITSTALYENHQKLQISTVGTMISAGGFAFDRALFANSDLSIDEGLVDSFDSTGAPYAPYLTLSGVGFTGTPLKKAPVGSNKNANNSVMLGNASGSLTALVDGDIYIGLGGSATSVNETGGSGNHTGSAAPIYADKVIPKVFIPTGTATITFPPNTVVNVQSGNTYNVTNLTLDNVTVVVNGTGDVSLYVENDIDIKNNSSLNMAGKPRQLQIYMVDTGTGVADINGSNATMLLAGGKAKVKIKDTQIFGAVMADKLSMKGTSQLHYDTSIATSLVGKADFSATRTFAGSSVVGQTAQVVAAGTSATGTSATGTSAVAGTSATGTGCGCGGCGCLLQMMQCY